MPICRKCRTNIAQNIVECDECGEVFHPGCLVNFTAKKTQTHCCKRTSDRISAVTVGANGPLPIPLKPPSQLSTRSKAFDAARALGQPTVPVQESASCTATPGSGDSTFSTPPTHTNKRQLSPPSPSVTPALKHSREEACSPPPLSGNHVDLTPLEHQLTQASPTESQSKYNRSDVQLNHNKDSESGMAGEMPDWFKTYYNEYRSDKEEYRKDKEAQKTALDGMSNRMQAIEETLEATSKKHSEEIVNLRSELREEIRTEVRAEMATVRRNPKDADTCEVILAGLPCSLKMDPFVIACKVFSAIGLPRLENHITATRPWTQRSRDSSDGPGSLQGTSSVAMVARLGSPANRDLVMQNASKLDKLNAQMIFGVGGTAKIFINPIYPKSIYNLRKKAHKAARELGYARPIVMNMVVCMRQTRGSPLIPIYSEADLEVLAPFTPSTQ